MKMQQNRPKAVKYFHCLHLNIGRDSFFFFFWTMLHVYFNAREKQLNSKLKSEWLPFLFTKI